MGVGGPFRYLEQRALMLTSLWMPWISKVRRCVLCQSLATNMITETYNPHVTGAALGAHAKVSKVYISVREFYVFF